MFEFEFTEEQRMLRDMAREFVNAEIKPIAQKIDEEEKYPRVDSQDCRSGILGASFPQEYGGGGFGELDIALCRRK